MVRTGPKARTVSQVILILIVGFAVAACNATTDTHTARYPGTTNYLTGHPAIPKEGLINVVVEIPAGTSAKWEVSESGASIEWDLKNGKPRVVQYLAYPGNYGMIPRTRLPREIGGDGDPLDVILLGTALERGSVVRARPIAVLRLLDEGERDDKILAVQINGPLSGVTNIQSLEERYAGASTIIETWFTHYKGPGRLESQGMAGSEAAIAIIREASEYFERDSVPSSNLERPKPKRQRSETIQ